MTIQQAIKKGKLMTRKNWKSVVIPTDSGTILAGFYLTPADLLATDWVNVTLKKTKT